MIIKYIVRTKTGGEGKTREFTDFDTARRYLYDLLDEEVSSFIYERCDTVIVSLERTKVKE